MKVAAQMSRSGAAWIAGAAALLFVACAVPATARDAQSSSSEVQTQLTALRVWNSETLKQYPALMDVEAAVTGDCRAKLAPGVNFVDYCSCARAVTMNLWMTAGDEQMVERLKTYAANPNSGKPEDFLQYQGPELYKPFCDLAVGAN